jgi:hypothetical protein
MKFDRVMPMTIIVTPRLTCRICDSRSLISCLDFGQMSLTGVFSLDGLKVDKAPLHLGFCGNCGLVQLLHSYSQNALYGIDYGYESHLNSSMSSHLQNKARILESRFLEGKKICTVVDIASNDGTLLAGYTNPRIHKIGIDPILEFLEDRYPENSTKIPSFFNESCIASIDPNSIDLVTSLSVLYDLDDPIKFAQGIATILREGGIWHFEQSYLPSMIKTLSYDTICHEHLLYLSLHDIMNILNQSGFTILDASLNSINGGSIAVTAVKSNSRTIADPFVDFLLNSEIAIGLKNGNALFDFATKTRFHTSEFRNLISNYRKQGKTIFGLGASTKGNVLLQAAEISDEEVVAIGDINPKKFGKRTPGTNIPIISETELVKKSNLDSIYLILPWHFRQNIIGNCQEVLNKNGRFLIPLPDLEVVSN